MNIEAMLFLCIAGLLALLFVCAILAYVLFHLSVYRTLKLVRVEHRQLLPALVWFGLVPVAGLFVSIGMILGVSYSLRRQFVALGEHEPGDSYGLSPGQFWFCGLALAAEAALAGNMPAFSETAGPVMVLGMTGSMAAWIVYWIQIDDYKERLQRHFTTDSHTPEEQDYGDGLQKGHPDEEDRP
ncbi:hypothetical protein [Zavarzinella formosa]|uniref:hypothetical protein n=1 Tax=Zavarzinella formosa TaxID=360055 RepID=UPI000373E225|nr:hypothetical protein [Zavarzinella formosa]